MQNQALWCDLALGRQNSSAKCVNCKNSLLPDPDVLSLTKSSRAFSYQSFISDSLKTLSTTTHLMQEQGKKIYWETSSESASVSCISSSTELQLPKKYIDDSTSVKNTARAIFLLSHLNHFNRAKSSHLASLHVYLHAVIKCNNLMSKVLLEHTDSQSWKCFLLCLTSGLWQAMCAVSDARLWHSHWIMW